MGAGSAGAASARAAAAAADDYAIGADLSFLKQQEDAGKTFKDEGVVSPGLVIFRKHNYNWSRLRIFHTPTSLPNSLPYTLALAKQAKALGFRFLLDFHYSDTWADPGSQPTPKAWAGLEHATTVDSVYRYTRDVIARFRAEGVHPAMVQVGNEINNGLIWPDGKDWSHQADILKAGVRGVDSGKGDGPAPRVMIHIASGGDSSFTKFFFDNVGKAGIKYDVIGQSFYPLWHGTPDDLRPNLAFTSARYGMDIIVVEMAFSPYPSGGSPFPLTDQGQVDYLKALDKIVRGTPGGRGKGFMWWEPTGDAYLGTPRGLFDAQRNARPAMKVFDGLVAIQALPGGRPAHIDMRLLPARPLRHFDGPVHDAECLVGEVGNFLGMHPGIEPDETRPVEEGGPAGVGLGEGLGLPGVAMALRRRYPTFA